MLVFCNGFAFSTKAATPIVRSPDNGWDETGWVLYQTPRGGYLRVTYGPEGEEVSFLVITYEHAKQLIADPNNNKVSKVIWPVS